MHYIEKLIDICIGNNSTHPEGLDTFPGLLQRCEYYETESVINRVEKHVDSIIEQMEDLKKDLKRMKWNMRMSITKGTHYE